MNPSEYTLRVEEVALHVGCSVKTINVWYAWKKNHEDHELAKLLPDYYQQGHRQTRYWKTSDIWKLIEFKKSIPQGRNGVLGEVTQKYIKNRKERMRNGTNGNGC